MFLLLLLLLILLLLLLLPLVILLLMVLKAVVDDKRSIKVRIVFFSFFIFLFAGTVEPRSFTLNGSDTIELQAGNLTLQETATEMMETSPGRGLFVAQCTRWHVDRSYTQLLYHHLTTAETDICLHNAPLFYSHTHFVLFSFFSTLLFPNVDSTHINHSHRSSPTRKLAFQLLDRPQCPLLRS